MLPNPALITIYSMHTQKTSYSFPRNPHLFTPTFLSDRKLEKKNCCASAAREKHQNRFLFRILSTMSSTSTVSENVVLIHSHCTRVWLFCLSKKNPAEPRLEPCSAVLFRHSPYFPLFLHSLIDSERARARRGRILTTVNCKSFSRSRECSTTQFTTKFFCCVLP